MQSYNPPAARRQGLGSSHFARHYSGNHYYFLFLSLLRCFSSGGWLPDKSGWYFFKVPGCPIRKSSDVLLVCSSPKLIAAYHVLHRLSDPRHPPYALNCFKKIQIYFKWIAPLRLILLFLIQLFFQYVKELHCLHGKQIMRCLRLWTFRTKFNINFKRTKARNNESPLICGGYRSRTDDPLRARQML